MWSNPRHNVSRVPDAMLYRLPPPVRTRFPESDEARRSRVFKSWLPAGLFAIGGGAWYAYAKLQPDRQRVDLDKVPDFLQRALEKRQREKDSGTTPSLPK